MILIIFTLRRVGRDWGYNNNNKYHNQDDELLTYIVIIIFSVRKNGLDQ